MSASIRRPTPLFQPGIAAMYACTGASPSALAICGLPPLSSFGGLALEPVFVLVFGVDLRGLGLMVGEGMDHENTPAGECAPARSRQKIDRSPPTATLLNSSV